MPRTRLSVWTYFKKTKNDRNKDIVVCNYCSQIYVFPNATRMTNHILKCNKCPTDIKEALRTNDKGRFKSVLFTMKNFMLCYFIIT